MSVSVKILMFNNILYLFLNAKLFYKGFGVRIAFLEASSLQYQDSCISNL